MKKIAIFIFVLILSVSCIFMAPEGEIRLQETLLDDQFVVSMALDDDGMAWVGIIRDQYGLVKINPDGSTEIFDHTNSCLTDSMNIWEIDIDSQGKVWMLNDNSLICYDGNVFTRYDSIDNFYIPQVSENLLAIDQNDNIWFIGYNPWVNCLTQQIFSFDGENFTSYEPNGLDLNAGPYISDIEVDRAGNVWFSFYRGDPLFLKYDGSQWTSYDSSDIGYEPYKITDMAFDSENNLWFNDDYTFAGGAMLENQALYVFDGVHEAEAYGDLCLISEIAVDDQDNVWMTGLAPRLAVLDMNKKWVNEDSDDITYCRVMMQSSNGDMWMGTSTGIKIYRYMQAK